MIDLNAAMTELELEGRVRLYHAQQQGFWTCGVYPEDHGSVATHWGNGETPEEAIRVCLAVKANKAAAARLGAVLKRYAPVGWRR